jgi:hypothetical protein
VQLESGLPFLLYAKLQDSVPALSIKNPPSSIVKQWSDIIQEHGRRQTILVFDSLYMDATSYSILTESGTCFMAAVSGERFPEAKSMVHDLVTKPGEFAGVHRAESDDLFMYVWDTNTDIGKKYVFSNAFIRYAGRTIQSQYPVYDLYNLTFKTCDTFNRNLHDRTWPHRNGGGGRSGEKKRMHDFFFSALLQNVFNVWVCEVAPVLYQAF